MTTPGQPAADRQVAAQEQRGVRAMDQPTLRSLARCRAVLVTPLVALGMVAGTAPAAAAAPASPLAAIRTPLGAAVSVAGYFQQAELTASDAASGDGFGDSVVLSASGSTALVGAPYAGTGTAYVFARRHGTWSQTAELTSPHEAQFDDFGDSVALSASGNTALVGAPLHSDYAEDGVKPENLTMACSGGAC